MIENKSNLTKAMLILDAAQSVFLRFGYKRVTMADIAEAAHISRPAVYLLFPNKESVFKAVIRRMNDRKLETIHQGLAKHTSLKDQINFAFDAWIIKPFDDMKQSSEANDLIHSAHLYAQDVIDASGEAFEKILVSIMADHHVSNLHTKKLARLMRGAARGFKEIAQDTRELRQLLRDFIDIILKVLA